MLRTTTDEVPQVRKVAAMRDILALQVLVRQVPIASHVLRYAVRLITATDPQADELRDYAQLRALRLFAPRRADARAGRQGAGALR